MKKLLGITLISLLMAASRAPAATQSLGGVNLTAVAPRILTPNDDAGNDKVFFQFDDTLAGLPLETAVYDLRGAKVSDLVMNSNATALTWNGKNTDGQFLPAGIYIYSIRIGKNAATGTVVVAR